MSDFNVFRWQAEGSRFDTEAINNDGVPSSPLNAKAKFFQEQNQDADEG